MFMIAYGCHTCCADKESVNKSKRWSAPEGTPRAAVHMLAIYWYVCHCGCLLQAAEDAARLTELQESVMALTQQVQQLLPLQPRCSTLEVERDTAQHKLDRLQVPSEY